MSLSQPNKMLSLRSVLLLVTFCALSSAKSPLILLDEDNWEDMLKGEWLIEFYAPWCPACKALDPVWREFASWSDDLGIKVGQVDVTASPGLSGRFMITALPTIFHVKDGEFRQFRGSRDRDEFLSFIEEKKWKVIEVISPWRSPASAQMSAISGIFKLSMVLRNLHTRMTEEIGLPYWGSYLVFGLATIIFGTVLALVIVFVIDCLCPPKNGIRGEPAFVSSKENEKEEDEEELIDENDSPWPSATQSEEEDQEAQEETEATEKEVAKEGTEDNHTLSASPVRQRRARKTD